MREQRFDTVLKQVTAGGSRRRMVLGVLGGAFGLGAGSALTPRPAAAATWCRCIYLCPEAGGIAKCFRESCPSETHFRGEICGAPQGTCGFASRRDAC
jgi:hypothetical protein